MKWLGLVFAVFLMAACSSGQPAYLNGVKALPDDQAHPLYRQLVPLLEKPGEMGTDQLIRTWKEFLGTAPAPLREDGTYSFVYYDFTHQLGKVFLEASFAPRGPEPLTRVGSSFLFLKVYSISKPAAVKYRFTDGTRPLYDPFNADLEPGDDLWQPLTAPASDEPTPQHIVGASETALEGQSVFVLLPPSYRRDLAHTYPLVVIAGLDGIGWSQPLGQLMREGSIKPVIAVSMGGSADLKTLLEERLVPWVRARYRASKLPSELTLVGWGAAAQPAQALADARPDFWNKTWAPLADQARGEEAWNTLAMPFFRTQFPVVAP